MKIPRKYFPHYSRYKKRIETIPTQGNPKRIVVISDTHISNTGIFNRDIFKKGIEEISRIKKVDYIIHLGDITHDGTYLNYLMALDYLIPIRNENFYAIPGNHDSKNVGYLLFEEFFNSRSFEIAERDFFILGIDSSIPDQDSGKIGIRTIERCKELLLEHSENTKIFCFHHQLIPIPLTGRERSAILDGGDALKMILETNVDLVLNGHRHISNVYSCSNGEGEIVIFNSGTFSCNKTRFKELFSYTIIDVFEKAIVFMTKKLLDGEKIRRGRYINRLFNPNPPKGDKRIVAKIIQIANTHFSKINFNEVAYNKAVQIINDMDIDFVIHCGDITNSNDLSEFKLAHTKLKEIKHPLLIVPGNNDLRTVGWDIFPKFIGPLEPSYETERIRLLGINSIDNSLINGVIGRKKIRDAIDFFKNQPNDKINVIFFYHTVIPNPRSKFERMLSDSGNVLKFFTDPENKIHFLLTGHDHIAFSLQLEDTIVASCGTLSSKDYLSLDENTFNIINCYEEGYVEIEKYLISTNNSDIIGRYWINLR